MEVLQKRCWKLLASRTEGNPGLQAGMLQEGPFQNEMVLRTMYDFIATIRGGAGRLSLEEVRAFSLQDLAQVLFGYPSGTPPLWVPVHRMLLHRCGKQRCLFGLLLESCTHDDGPAWQRLAWLHQLM